ncbi:hypothetical protein GHT06_003840 [Daphnia sinensis]|uniref:Uncharacterized protein n=1 Tax=Daphnia sinensis TaxID=1820382 RepID=A0AAD5KDT6_9CRUS|nr:hypothetical protein GHT06_003840 [Daphnia sinensis]
MSCLTIFCTEIAALIGRHPYRTLDEAIGALLLHNERVVHKEFPHLKTQLREARVKDAGGKKREFICRKRHGGVLESGLAKMAKAECPEEVRVLLDETLAEIDEPDERDVARGIVFKTFGTRNEDNVILEYERLTGRRLTEKNTDFRLSRAFSTPSGISYKIGGRIDGVCDELGKLVEVKNRIHKSTFQNTTSCRFMGISLLLV